jgi:blue copper oxidase
VPHTARTVDAMALPPPVAPRRKRRKRRWRRVVAWAGAAVVALVAVAAGIFAWVYAGADVSTAGKLDFENPLRIPELFEGERGDDGVVRFDLDVQAGTTQFRDGSPTETWGVNGPYLGPTLRAARGDVVEIAVRNDLDEATTMHWHGMHLPARMDGGPHQPIGPGETWRPTWTVDQPAATLWYHPHPHGDTAEHVHRGVAGMFILEDDQSAALDLPHTYGVDDLPVIIQDRSFDDDNQFDGGGVDLGDELLVNGTHDPHVDVTHERVRVRLLNASGARFYDLGFVDGRPFEVIATDGGLLQSPVTVDRVPLSPGERAEIVVAFEPGEQAVLRSFPRGSGGGFFVDRFDGHDDTFDVLQFRAADDLVSSAPPPARLADVERLDPADAVATRTFRLSGTQINSQEMDMDRIDAAVTAGTAEIWEVSGSGEAHNFHVHGVQFQVLDIDGAAPHDRLRGWKDTVEVRAGTTTRLLVPFGAHTDPDMPYMFHCHKLRHEDRGMMGQHVVVEPGQTAGTPPTGHDHD